MTRASRILIIVCTSLDGVVRAGADGGVPAPRPNRTAIQKKLRGRRDGGLTQQLLALALSHRFEA